MSDKVNVHKNVKMSLFHSGMLDVAQEAILSLAGPQETRRRGSHLRYLPAIVDKAVSSLIGLSRALSGSTEAFDGALNVCQDNWKKLGESLEAADGSFLRGEDAVAAISYTNHLNEFRRLWLRLFGAAYSSGGRAEFPPHVFAVHWSEVSTADNLKWMQDAKEGSQRTLAEIELGKAPSFTYFLYILQHTLAVRIELLRCVAEIVENSFRCVNVMVTVRYVHMARTMQREMAKQQKLWEELGLLTPSRLAELSHYHNFESQVVCKFPRSLQSNSTSSKAFALPALFHMRCPFIWIMLNIVWGLQSRLSFLFRNCLTSFSHKKEPTSRDRLKGGSPAIDEQNRVENECQIPSSNVTSLPEGESVAKSEGEKEKNARQNGASTSGPPAAVRNSGRQLRFTSPYDLLMAGLEAWRGNSFRRRNDDGPPQIPVKLTPPFGLCLSPVLGSDCDFVLTRGCRCLVQLLLSITRERNGTTFLLVSDCTRRPGKRAWYRHHYNFGAITSNMTVSAAKERSNGGGQANEDSEMKQLEHWVVNCVFPQRRLSDDAEKRLEQERALIQSVALQALKSPGRRMHFVGDSNSAFYVLRSYEDMDGGRLYFALLLPHCNKTPNTGAEVTVWAFSAMETLCSMWSMPHLSNVAVRLAMSGI